MEIHFDLGSAGLTVALALAAGMVAQSIAHHIRLPGIVLLLATGVVLGPDVANVVRPDLLGDGLLTLVGFAVAVILFEGGLSLELRRLQRAQRAIRNLVTIGAVVTAVGGTLVARLFMGWDWRLCILFGTLVIVTGPTVITPLLRRLNVQKRVATVLEAEGVLIDAVGAITAAVAIEVALSPSADSVAAGALYIAGRLAFGAAAGLVGGLVMGALLRFRHVIPHGLENVLTLALALSIFEASNALMHESGIAAVTVAGIVVGNTQMHVRRELAEFKEQLTVLLIGMLFVLLAADVRLAGVVGLGWPGVLTVAALIAVIRPLNVVAGTLRTDLTVKERAFIAWIGPRGIVAAAVASLFALELEQAGVPGGPQLRALVFLVITVTVLWAGLTGGLVAKLLGVRRQSGAGWVLLGANRFARTVAALLATERVPVVSIDGDADCVRAAEARGLRVLHGNGLEESMMLKAEIDTRKGALAVTGNEEVNLLFAQKSARQTRGLPYLVVLNDWTRGVTPEMVDEHGFSIAFGAAVRPAVWSTRIERETASLEWWRRVHRGRGAEALTWDEENPAFVVLVRRLASGLREPVHDRTRFGSKDACAVLIDEERRAQAVARLAGLGWEPLPEDERHIDLAETRPTDPKDEAVSA